MIIPLKTPNQFFQYGKPNPKNKYRRGDQIRTIQQFDLCVKTGTWIYWYGKPRHSIILENQQYRVLRELIKGGHLFEAVLNQPKENKCQSLSKLKQ
jgi:hypothetical protein